VVLTLSTTHRHALASPAERVTLRYYAPAGCPQQADILRAVNAQLGEDYATATSLRVDARVLMREAQNYELLIDYATQEGARDERTIRGESCAAVTEAAVLLITLGLTQNAPARLLKPRSKRSVGATTSTIDLGPSVAVQGMLDSALLPAWAFGGAVRVGLHVGALHISAGIRALVPQSIERAGITTSLYARSVELAACYLQPVGSFALGPCLGLELGQILGSTHGTLENAQNRSARFQAASASVELRWRIASPFWLALNASIEWIERRPQFVIVGIGTVASPATLGARLSLGPVLSWQ
jgi:hypothetical protein